MKEKEISMEIEKIKQFTPSNGERMILIEDGKPMAVLISFDDYQKMTGNSIVKEEKIEEEKTELTLEDLPF